MSVSPFPPQVPAQTGAVLFIDLDAIAANWRALEARQSPACRAAAVVKADAYGLGAAPVAAALAAAGCRRFVVATLDEGLALRAGRPEAEILVLSGPLQGTASLFAGAGLWPVLNSLEQVADWRALATRQQRPLPAALHVDTGMRRLGLSAADLARLSADPALLAGIDPRLLMSHLACADEPEHPLNALQRQRFAAARALFPGLPGSLAASSGIFLGPAWHADWTRPGAALYGLNPTPGAANPMAPVARLAARILQVRDVDAGDSVGYGASYRCAAPTRLAIVAAGYADGLFRALGNRGCGHFGEQPVPLVGRVSMDLTIFDVGIASTARPGDSITLMGPGNDADAIARAAGTIGYEILTALGARYHRHYLGGAA